MAECLEDNGWKIICMDMEYIPGKMDENMKASTSTIKSMAREHICGLMDGNTQEDGKTAASMVKEFIAYQMVQVDEVFGLKEEEITGWINIIVTNLILSINYKNVSCSIFCKGKKSSCSHR